MGMGKQVGRLVAMAVVCMIFVGCTKAAAPAATSTELDSAMGVFGVSSPLAASDVVVAQRGSLKSRRAASWMNSLVVTASVPFVNVLKFFGWMRPAVTKKALATTDDLATVTEEIEETLAATTSEDCVAGAFTVPTPPNAPICYGPAITYDNHPDGADAANNCNGGANVCLPSGDLGIWVATQVTGPDTEACSAAKMNQVISSVSERVNAAQKAFAATLCLAKVAGLDMPAAGASLDVVTLLNDNVPGAAFTTATLSNLSTVREGGVATYELVLDGVKGTAPYVLTLTHSPTNADNTTFMGHMFGKIGPNTTNVTAFSMTYAQDGTNLNAVLKSGDMTTNASPFDGDNELDYTDVNLDGHSVIYNHVFLDVNGLGTALAAWQANPNDPNTRVFNAQTSRSGSDDTGYAYFGFGDSIETSADRGKISKMICNWAGPGNDHTGLANKAQGQAIERDAATGLFVPSAGGNHITYAATNSCNNGANTFAVGTSDTTAPAAVGVVTHNLVDLADYVGDLGTISTLTAPTY